MRFSGKKKGKGFGRFADGSPRGARGDSGPARSDSAMDGAPGVLGVPGERAAARPRSDDEDAPRAPQRKRPGAKRSGSGGRDERESRRGSRGRSGGRRSRDRDEERPRYGRRGPQKSSTPMIIGGIAVLLVIIVIALVATRGGGASSPQDALFVFTRAIRARNGAKVYDMLSSSSQAAIESALQSVNKDFSSMNGREMFIRIFSDIDRYDLPAGMDAAAELEVRDARISGSSAVLTVFNRSTRIKSEMNMVREGGGWKIDLR